MKFTLSWLKRHLETNVSCAVLCDKLTAIGLEVEGVENAGAALNGFTIALIKTAEKHPQADRLQVCSVDTGDELLQIVCGAPNARAGIKVVLAQPGVVIPKTGEALKKGVIRGVESQGMMCSAAELMLGDDHHGIIELPEDAPVGAAYALFAGLDDPVIEINLTPNRGDCAGVRGVARDLAAAGMGTLKPLDFIAPKGTTKGKVGVEFGFSKEEAFACPHFVGREIRNIQNRPSPEWMQRLLRAVGSRPISALVDVTNFLSIDCGRPLHVFDADTIKGNLRVWAAQGGETLLALNEKTYTLQQGMTVIGDDTGIHSLAGVMGGEGTGCADATTNVFIESAYFDPGRTAKTGQALQLTSDARYRFERGVDPAFVRGGADYAAALILHICATDGTTVCAPVEVGAEVKAMRIISYDPKKCLKHLGVDVSVDEQKRILSALGFGIQDKGATLDLTVPSWRGDVIESADITEEVIRIKGYEHIPSVSMPRTTVLTPCAFDKIDRRAEKARRAMASQGMDEAVTFSFMPSGLAESFGGGAASLTLLNPISGDLDAMRPSILGNLLMAVERNAARGYADVSLFEVGPVYKSVAPDGQAIVATGLRAGKTPRHWAVAARAVDVFDAKNDALAVLIVCGAPVASLQVTADAPAWYHPGRSGCLRLGANVLATFGEIHPAIVAGVDYSGTVVGCEVFLENISESRKASTARTLLKLEELQPVFRDFAFVMARSAVVEKLVRAVAGVDKALIRDVSVFDVYEGDKIEADKKSVAISVTLQPVEHTLTDKEMEALSAKIAQAAEKAVGAVLRA